MIKVLYFLPGTILGGAETQLLTLFKKIDRTKFKLGLVTNATPENLIEPFWLQLKQYATVYSASTVGQIAEAIRSYGPDVVHHFHNPYMSPAMDMAGFTGPAIEVVHGCVNFPNDSTQTPKHHTSEIVCVSEDAKEFFLRALPAWHERVSVVPNGIETERFTASDAVAANQKNALRILHVGRLCEGDKQYIKIISACLKLPTQNWELWLVGTGADRDMIFNYAAYHAPGKVKFFGYNDQPEKIYQKCHIYVSRSPSEGFGLSVAEAASAGLAINLWDCGGVARYFTHGKNALISKTDPDFNHNLKILAGDEFLRERMGKQARDLAIAHFSSEKMAEDYEIIYERTLERHRKGIIKPGMGDAPRVTIKTPKKILAGFSNPNFTGVSNAVKGWVGEGRWVPASPDNLQGVYSKIVALRPEVVVIGGDSGYLQLVKTLRQNLPHTKFLMTWHSTFSFNDFAPGDGRLLTSWIEALRGGLIHRLGFVRKNQHLALNDDRAVYFPNRVPKLQHVDKLKHNDKSFHIGVFGSGYPWKNMQQMIIGAARGGIPHPVIHVNELNEAALIKSLGINVVGHGHMSRHEFHKLLASMHVNIQGSFTESFGLTFCESYRLGVPCITTPGVQVIKDHEYMVKDPDDIKSVGSTLWRAYKDESHIGYVNDCLDALDLENKEIIEQVLEEL